MDGEAHFIDQENSTIELALIIHIRWWAEGEVILRWMVYQILFAYSTGEKNNVVYISLFLIQLQYY